MVILVPKFGYTLGMKLGMLVWFSVINHTILTHFLYSFWVWYDEWVIFLEKILLSLKIVIHDHYQSHTCDTYSNKLLFYRPIIVQWKLVACENSYNNWGWFEYLYSWSIVLNFRNHFWFLLLITFLIKITTAMIPILNPSNNELVHILTENLR